MRRPGAVRGTWLYQQIASFACTEDDANPAGTVQPVEAPARVPAFHLKRNTMISRGSFQSCKRQPLLAVCNACNARVKTLSWTRVKASAMFAVMALKMRRDSDCRGFRNGVSGFARATLPLWAAVHACGSS